MRGHKHPLEIFRESGRSFQTRGQGSQAGAPHEGLAEASRRGLKGAYLERAREMAAGHGGAQVTSASDVAAQKPRRERDESSTAAESVKSASVKAEAAVAPTRRAWNAPPQPTRSEKARGASRPASRQRSLSLRALAGVLTALVILVGAAYALHFWPFVPNGEAADHSTSLRRYEHWRNPSGPAGDGGASADDTALGRASSSGASDTLGATPAATAAPEVEYWVLAGSEKLSGDRRKDWKQRWGLEKQRVVKALGNEFPAMQIQVCTADAQGNEALLRIGPALTENDAELQKVLAKVRALGGSFASAFTKKFKKQ